MEKIEEKVKQFRDELDEKMKELEVLEKEKANLMAKYQKGEEREKLEQEMRRSEEKYKNLCDEVCKISIKVEKLKEQIS